MAHRVVTRNMLKMMNNTETFEDTCPKSRDCSPHARVKSPVLRRHTPTPSPDMSRHSRTPIPDAARLKRTPIRSHPPSVRYHWSAENDHEERPHPHRPIRGSSQQHDYGDVADHLHPSDRERPMSRPDHPYRSDREQPMSQPDHLYRSDREQPMSRPDHLYRSDMSRPDHLYPSGRERRMSHQDHYHRPSARYNTRSSAASQVKLSLPKYNGRTKWKTFRSQFEAVTADWDDDERLYHLLANLTGEAADFAFELEEYVRQDIDSLFEELERRFRVSETPQTSARQFYRRKLRSGESIKQFAADLKTLVRKAYPRGLNRWAMEQMLIKQFFDGLDDDELRYHVEYLKMPRDLDDAVDLVYEHDEFRRINRDNAKSKIQAIQDSEYEWCQQVTASYNVKQQVPDGPKSELIQLQQTLLALASNLNKYLSVPSSGKVADSDRNCYGCGQMGHFKRQCPNMPRNQVKLVCSEYAGDGDEGQDITENEETSQQVNW